MVVLDIPSALREGGVGSGGVDGSGSDFLVVSGGVDGSGSDFLIEETTRPYLYVSGSQKLYF